MRDLKPPAASCDLADVSHLGCHEFGNSKARIIGKADERRIAQTDDVGATGGK
jgi:hypothetical protein